MAKIKYADSGRPNFTPNSEYDVLGFGVDSQGDPVAVVLDDDQHARAVLVTSEFTVVPPASN